jgi:hypothetical protein
MTYLIHCKNLGKYYNVPLLSTTMKKKIAGHPWFMSVILAYLGGSDQEDCSSKPARGNSLMRPYLKKTLHKKGWGSGSRCKP